jgi:hypothetical protein
MELACTACCTARLYNLVWTVALRTLAKAELEAMGWKTILS